MNHAKKILMILSLLMVMLIFMGSVSASDNLNMTLQENTDVLGQNQIDVVDNNDIVKNDNSGYVSNQDSASDILKTTGNDIMQVHETVINNISIDKEAVYGKDLSVNVYGNVSIINDAQKYKVWVSIAREGINASTDTILSDNGLFTAKLNLGVLAVDDYDILVHVINQNDTEGDNAVKLFNNTLHVIKDNVTVVLDNTTVVYGIDNSTVINGSVIKEGYGANWSGKINVTIGDYYNYNNIPVINGEIKIPIQH